MRLLLASATTLVLSDLASGTTVIPPTFTEMVTRADLIFEGTVTGARSELRDVGTNRVVFTLVQFQTHEVLKGAAAPSVTLQFLGGTVGDVTMEIVGVPKFKTREHVILFVQGNGVQFCPVVGVYHGKFRLRRDETTGRETVIMHTGTPLHDVVEIGADDGVRLELKRAAISVSQHEPMSVDSFRSKILDEIRKQLGQK